MTNKLITINDKKARTSMKENKEIKLDEPSHPQPVNVKEQLNHELIYSVEIKDF